MKKTLATPNYSIKELSQSDFVSELVHRIGHEVGNPLTAIIALASILPLESDHEKVLEHAKSIKAEAWKINALNEKLILLLSDKLGNCEACDLEEATYAAESKIRTRYGVGNLNLRVHAQENCSANIDKDQLISLISELLLNAFQNSSDRNNSINCSINKEPNNFATLHITNLSDKACPFALENVFEPLVTGHETAKHLGLGLAIAHAITSRFSGSIDISEEQVPDGYLFSAKICLPAA